MTAVTDNTLLSFSNWKIINHNASYTSKDLASWKIKHVKDIVPVDEVSPPETLSVISSDADDKPGEQHRSIIYLIDANTKFDVSSVLQKVSEGQYVNLIQMSEIIICCGENRLSSFHQTYEAIP